MEITKDVKASDVLKLMQCKKIDLGIGWTAVEYALSHKVVDDDMEYVWTEMESLALSTHDKSMALQCILHLFRKDNEDILNEKRTKIHFVHESFWIMVISAFKQENHLLMTAAMKLIVYAMLHEIVPTNMITPLMNTAVQICLTSKSGERRILAADIVAAGGNTFPNHVFPLTLFSTSTLSYADCCFLVLGASASSHFMAVRKKIALHLRNWKPSETILEHISCKCHKHEEDIYLQLSGFSKPYKKNVPNVPLAAGDIPLPIRIGSNGILLDLCEDHDPEIQQMVLSCLPTLFQKVKKVEMIYRMINYLFDLYCTPIIMVSRELLLQSACALIVAGGALSEGKRLVLSMDQVNMLVDKGLSEKHSWTSWSNVQSLLSVCDYESTATVLHVVKFMTSGKPVSVEAQETFGERQAAILAAHVDFERLYTKASSTSSVLAIVWAIMKNPTVSLQLSSYLLQKIEKNNESSLNETKACMDVVHDVVMDVDSKDEEEEVVNELSSFMKKAFALEKEGKLSASQACLTKALKLFLELNTAQESIKDDTIVQCLSEIQVQMYGIVARHGSKDVLTFIAKSGLLFCWIMKKKLCNESYKTSFPEEVTTFLEGYPNAKCMLLALDNIDDVYDTASTASYLTDIIHHEMKKNPEFWKTNTHIMSGEISWKTRMDSPLHVVATYPFLLVLDIVLHYVSLDITCLFLQITVPFEKPQFINLMKSGNLLETSGGTWRGGVSVRMLLPSSSKALPVDFQLCAACVEWPKGTKVFVESFGNTLVLPILPTPKPVAVRTPLNTAP